MIVAVGIIAALHDIPQHAGVAVAAFALLTLASICATTIFWKRDDALAIAVVLVVAVVARSLLFWKTPFLSTDLYRYLWDGRLMVHGIDPYVVTPADPTLHYFRLGWLYQHLDWRSMPSLYPPLGLALFALAVKVSHANLLGTKLLMEAGDLVTLWLLVVAATPTPAASRPGGDCTRGAHSSSSNSPGAGTWRRGVSPRSRPRCLCMSGGSFSPPPRASRQPS